MKKDIREMWFAGRISWCAMAMAAVLPSLGYNPLNAETDESAWTFNALHGWTYTAWFPYVYSELGWVYMVSDSPDEWDRHWGYAYGFGWYWAALAGKTPWIFSDVLGDSGYLDRAQFAAALQAKPIRIQNSQAFPAELEGDPFDVAAAVVVGDQLKIDVSYAGGCAPHQFFLMSDFLVLESFPPHAILQLIRNNNADTCEMMIPSEITFDISSLLELWRGTSSSTIIVNINPHRDWGQAQLTVDL